MKNIWLSLAAVAVLGACSFGNDDENHFVVVSGEDDTSYLKDIDACPKVHIRQNDTKIVQIDEYHELFTIEAVGYEGHCYYNKKLGKDKAVVKPKFKITRMEESDVTDVHFSYCRLRRGSGSRRVKNHRVKLFKLIGRKRIFKQIAFFNFNIMQQMRVRR